MGLSFTSGPAFAGAAAFGGVASRGASEIVYAILLVIALSAVIVGRPATGITDAYDLSDGGPRGFCGTRHGPTLGGEAAVASVRPTSSALPPADSSADPTVVDVMFVYTPQALIGAGDEAALRRILLRQVDEANHRFLSSLINVRLNPVYLGVVHGYVESGNLATDLRRAANGQGGMAQVGILRDDYKADLTCLVIETDDEGVGGMAWDIPEPDGNEQKAFCAVRRFRVAVSDVLFVHEIGHLFGCMHDREHAGGPFNHPWFQARHPYAFGHRFEVEGVTYATIMSYEPGLNVPHFSHPEVLLDGVRVGAFEEDALPSFNARTVNEVAPYVAGYREALSRIEFAETRVQVSEREGSVRLALRRHGDLTESTRLAVVFDGGTATMGEDYVRSSIATFVEFDAQEASGEMLISLLPDTLSEGDETIDLSLAAVKGAHAIGWQSTATVVILDDETFVNGPPGAVTVRESEGNTLVPVSFAGPFPEGSEAFVDVTWNIVGGAALAGEDFIVGGGTLTFTPSEREKEIQVEIIDDSTPEVDETFVVTVAGREFEVRILDDDRLGSLAEATGQNLEPDAREQLNVAVGAEGSLLVYGDFTRIGGIDQTCLARLTPEGALDPSLRPADFSAGHRPLPRVENARVHQARVLADGKILVAGQFSRVGGAPRTSLVRLHPGGSLDEDFGVGLDFDGQVLCFEVEADGKIVVGGSFTRIGTEDRAYVARLEADGSVDPTFQPQGGPTASWFVEIRTLVLQPDGKTVIGGNFDQVDGRTAANLARLTREGTFDPTFRAGRGSSTRIWRMARQPDGKILVSGFFNVLAGHSSRKIGRLHPDGSFDSSFRSPEPNDLVWFMEPFPDGRILVGGPFTRIGGRSQRYLAMLDADGSVDTTFNIGAGPDDLLYSATVHGDGSLYLGGLFRRFNDQTAPALVRLDLGNLAPAFGRQVRNEEGNPLYRIHGFPGGVYTVEASANLENWRPAGRVDILGHNREVEFEASATEPEEFFRLRPGTAEPVQ